MAVDKHTIRIHLDGPQSYVELDGEMIPNVIRVEVDTSRGEQVVKLTLAGIQIDVTGSPSEVIFRTPD